MTRTWSTAIGGPAAAALLGLAAAVLLRWSGVVELARAHASQVSPFALDEWLLAALLPVAGLLAAQHRVQRSLRLAAARRKAERDAARWLARHDPLTGLLNRRGLDDALTASSPAPRRVFLVDIDDFKALNDASGHALGDTLLQRFAERLEALAREQGALAARLGGDEFAIVVESDAARIDAVNRALAAPLSALGDFKISLSIGDAEFGEDGFADALDRADAAMYEAKRARALRDRQNRRVFEAHLAASSQAGEEHAVIAIAVNRVADAGRPLSYGEAGPLTRAVLAEIRRALPDAPVERLSNDVLGVVTGAGQVEQVTRVLQAITAECLVDDVTVKARLTIGRAGPAPRHDLRDAVEQAQLAAERARRSGRDLADFEESDRIALRANAALLRDLRLAIAQDALDLHFQPKLNLRTNAIDSLEALVRWTHPVVGPVSPGQFIPLAEESGDIRALTRWVFAAACRASATLQIRGLAQPIYVNISALLIADESFVSDLVAVAASQNARIGIEVTETACLQQPQRALANLKRLADAGFGIAIDDYGVGLSSLTYLRQMPASELKIDMSFIRDLSESHRDPLIVRSTIDLAHGLGLSVTAEGVDKAETLALLKIMGCDYGQGYHIAPAYPLDRCADFLLGWVCPAEELPDYAADLRRLMRPAA